MSSVAVVIVSWNARTYLRGCLDSVRHNGCSLIRQVIVVDNGSSDGSPEMVETEFPEVILIRRADNLGFARANNLGISYASTEFLALVNSDVVIHDGCLQQLVNFLAKNPDVGLVGPHISGPDGNPQYTCRRLPTVWNTLCRILALDTALPRVPLFAGRDLRKLRYDQPTPVEVISGCFWLVRRAALVEVGGLDERFFFYAEDVDWCKRFRDKRWKVFFVPTATATHYGGASSANAPLRYSIEMLRANIAYWRKHYGLPGQSFFYILCLLHHGLRLVARGALNIVGVAKSDTLSYKLKEDFGCLRWLLTGKRV